LIESTKVEGDNDIDSLQNIADVILKEHSGNSANKIINLTKTK
jgi:hypothetical protein